MTAHAKSLFNRTREFFTAFHENKGRDENFAGFFSPLFQYHMPGNTVADYSGILTGMKSLRDPLSQIKVTLLHATETADTVTFHFVYEGTREDGSQQKLGPTPVRYRFESGKVVQGWAASAIPA